MKKIVARSGRFAGGPAEEVARFSESVSFDWRLWKHDILGSMAHATMLLEIGILTKAEHKSIIRALDQIAADIPAGRFKWLPALEDVHMNIEAELTRRALPPGPSSTPAAPATTRSPWTCACGCARRSSTWASTCAAWAWPSWTWASATSTSSSPVTPHLQRAQPVFLAHHLLAYVEMFSRDYDRFIDCYQRVNVCPLGAGRPGRLDPSPGSRTGRQTPRFLSTPAAGPRITRNSMDAVSDRDFVLEFAAAAAISAVHLSRLAEDLILWASAEFHFIRIADAYTTGSSLMPQKKNPDVAELTRGKSARVIGNLMALLTLLKGLPMTYNRDLQEDKERLFDTADTLRACLRLMSGMLAHTTAHAPACAAAASDPPTPGDGSGRLSRQERPRLPPGPSCRRRLGRPRRKRIQVPGPDYPARIQAFRLPIRPRCLEPVRSRTSHGTAQHHRRPPPAARSKNRSPAGANASPNRRPSRRQDPPGVHVIDRRTQGCPEAQPAAARRTSRSVLECVRLAAAFGRFPLERTIPPPGILNRYRYFNVSAAGFYSVRARLAVQSGSKLPHSKTLATLATPHAAEPPRHAQQAEPELRPRPMGCPLWRANSSRPPTLRGPDRRLARALTPVALLPPRPARARMVARA